MKLNILIYDAGLGGDFLFNALVQSSNLKHKSKYIAYPQENNKWYCFDAFVMLFNTSYVPRLLNEYFDLKLFADIETGINQKTLANITNDELIKLLNFTSKIWFYNMKKLGFPQKQMQLWEIPTTTKVKEIDNLPDILYNLDEPFYTKGHWYSKLPNQTIIKLAWPKSKRSVLKNIWETKVAGIQAKYKNWEDKNVPYASKFEQHVNYVYVDDDFTYKKYADHLLVNSYRLIINPEKELFETMLDYFNYGNNLKLTWPKLIEYANKNKELYDE